MKRSKLRNIFNKKRSSENWQSYKQELICSNILKSTKNTSKHKFNNWWQKLLKAVKPFYTDVCNTSNSVILTEKKNEALNGNKKNPAPLTSISQTLPKSWICVNQQEIYFIN